MTGMHTVLPQGYYRLWMEETKAWVKDHIKSIPPGELAKFERFKESPESFEKGVLESKQRNTAAFNLMKAMVQARVEGKLFKAGLTSALGYSFYDLRAPVQLSYPVNVPFRNTLPRIGRVNDGYGTAAHWKATRSPGSVYAGVLEGQRNQIVAPDEHDYVASYKEIGVERGVSFTAQFAGEGYADNVADEHLRGLHELWLQEEGLMLLGNDGIATGNNGFAFNGLAGATATPTPVCTLKTGTGITTATKITVEVVLITALGYPNNAQYGYQAAPTVAAGLVPYFDRSNQDGSKTRVGGGTSKISPLSNSVTTTGGTCQVSVALPVAALPVKGAFAYAWFVSVNASPTLANSYLYKITTTPTLVINTDPATSGYGGDSIGLDTDYSYQATDFTGLMTYAASTVGAYWNDLYAASFTSSKDGKIPEIDALLLDRWNLFQAGVDEIWGSADAVLAIDQAVRYSGTSAGSFRFEYTRDSQGNLLGGFVVSAYQSRFTMAPNGYAIPIRIHPMIPAGTLFFHIKTNPYPHSRAPFVAGMLVQRDYYSIEWPLVTRQWTFGTYTHEVLAHNFPWISGVLTGVGPFVGT